MRPRVSPSVSSRALGTLMHSFRYLLAAWSALVCAGGSAARQTQSGAVVNRCRSDIRLVVGTTRQLLHTGRTRAAPVAQHAQQDGLLRGHITARRSDVHRGASHAAGTTPQHVGGARRGSWGTAAADATASPCCWWPTAWCRGRTPLRGRAAAGAAGSACCLVRAVVAAYAAACCLAAVVGPARDAS
jgi:hypothetical protein